MKISTKLAAAAVALMFLSAAPSPAESRDDIQVIKKAVKENPRCQPGKEVRWFKVLITDGKGKKDKVQITLPIFVVKALAKCAGDEPLRIDESRCDIKLSELLEDLTKAGPLSLLEISENGETVKIWLE